MKKIIALGIIMFFIRAGFAALVVNGDFENGLTGWTASSDVTTVPQGNPGNAARLTINNVSFSSWIKQVVGDVGQTYTVDFDVKMIDGGGAWDAFYDGIVLVQDFGTGPTSFTHYRFAATPTSTPALLFDFYQATPTGAMLLDNVTVVAAPEPTYALAGIVPLLAAVATLKRKSNTAKHRLSFRGVSK